MSKLSKSLDTYSKLVVAEHGLIAIAAVSSGVILGYGGLPSLRTLFLPGLVFCLSVYGLNAYNAVSDVGIDAISKPYRPIQKGDISKRNALWVVALLYFVAIALAYKMGSFFFYAVLSTVALGILYSAPVVYFKKRLLLGNLTLCLVYALIMPVAGFAYVSDIANLPWALPVLAVFLALPCSMLKDFEDYEGDKKFKINTIPVVFSIDASKKIVAFFLVLPYALGLFLVVAGFLNTKFLFFAFLGFFALLQSVNLFHIKKVVAGKAIFKGALVLNVFSGVALFLISLLS